MDFLSSQQVSASILETVEFDLFITVSAQVNRCTYLVSKYAISAEEKIALKFTEKKQELFGRKNLQIY